MPEILDRKGINQVVLVGSRLFFFSLQTFHTKTTSVAILDIVIRTFLSRRYGLLLRKISEFRSAVFQGNIKDFFYGMC